MTVSMNQPSSTTVCCADGDTEYRLFFMAPYATIEVHGPKLGERHSRTVVVTTQTYERLAREPMRLIAFAERHIPVLRLQEV